LTEAMTEKGPEFRDLTAGAESAHVTEVREPHGQLLVPTLEERVRLFLRAAHSERDFTNSEHVRARSTILNAMAADIAAKSKSGMPNEPLMKTVGRPIMESRRLSSRVMPVADALGVSSKVRAQRPVAPPASIPVSQPTRKSANDALAVSSMVRAQRPSEVVLGHIQVSEPHKPAKRRVFIWSAAASIFVGCILGGLALYLWRFYWP
jgi:hypothetical protein